MGGSRGGDSSSSRQQLSALKSQLKQFAPALTEATNHPDQLIWAHMEGYAPWPAKITQDDYTPKKFLVRFFGPESCGAWGSIRVDQARLFNKESARWMKSKAKDFAKGDTKEEKALLEAIAEALQEYRRSSSSSSSSSSSTSSSSSSSLSKSSSKSTKSLSSSRARKAIVAERADDDIRSSGGDDMLQEENRDDYDDPHDDDMKYDGGDEQQAEQDEDVEEDNPRDGDEENGAREFAEPLADEDEFSFERNNLSKGERRNERAKRRTTSSNKQMRDKPQKKKRRLTVIDDTEEQEEPEGDHTDRADVDNNVVGEDEHVESNESSENIEFEEDSSSSSTSGTRGARRKKSTRTSQKKQKSQSGSGNSSSNNTASSSTTTPSKTTKPRTRTSSKGATHSTSSVPEESEDYSMSLPATEKKKENGTEDDETEDHDEMDYHDTVNTLSTKSSSSGGGRKRGTRRRILKKKSSTTVAPTEKIAEAPSVETVMQVNPEIPPLDDMDVCYVCKQGGFLMLCDGCNNACHCECASPPLESVPEGEWFCMECQAKKIEEEKTAKMKEEETKKQQLIEQQKEQQLKRSTRRKAVEKKQQEKAEKMERNEKEKRSTDFGRTSEKSSEKKTSERKQSEKKSKSSTTVPRVSERVKNRKGRTREKLDNLNDESFLEGDDYENVMQSDAHVMNHIESLISAAVDHEIRPMDPVRRIFGRNYWSQLPKTNYGEFQIFQNETLLHTTTDKRGRRTRRAKATVDHDDDGLHAILQLLKENANEQTCTNQGSGASSSSTTSTSSSTASSKSGDKRKRSGKAHSRFVRSKKNYSDGEETPQPTGPKKKRARRSSSSSELKNVESEEEMTPITPINQDIFDRSSAGSSSSSSTSSKRMYPHPHHLQHSPMFNMPMLQNYSLIPYSSMMHPAAALPPMPSFSYMDEMEAHFAKKIESQQTCSVYIRYRYMNEGDDEYRLIKKELPFVASKSGIPASSVCHSILNDTCTSPSLIPEVRYFDFEEEGWLKMSPEYYFPVPSGSSVPTTIQLLICTCAPTECTDSMEDVEYGGNEDGMIVNDEEYSNYIMNVAYHDGIPYQSCY